MDLERKIPAAIISTGLLYAAYKKGKSFDDLGKMKAAVVQGGTQNKAMTQIEGGEGVFRVQGLKEMLQTPTLAPNFGTQNAYERSFGLTKEQGDQMIGLLGQKVIGEFKDGTVQLANERKLATVGQLGHA